MRTRPARVQLPRSIRTTATATLRTSKQRCTSDRGRPRHEHDPHRHLAFHRRSYRGGRCRRDLAHETQRARTEQGREGRVGREGRERKSSPPLPSLPSPPSLPYSRQTRAPSVRKGPTWTVPSSRKTPRTCSARRNPASSPSTMPYTAGPQEL